jgi:hypothetical protein
VPTPRILWARPPRPTRLVIAGACGATGITTPSISGVAPVSSSWQESSSRPDRRHEWRRRHRRLLTEPPTPAPERELRASARVAEARVVSCPGRSRSARAAMSPLEIRV